MAMDPKKKERIISDLQSHGGLSGRAAKAFGDALDQAEESIEINVLERENKRNKTRTAREKAEQRSRKIHQKQNIELEKLDNDIGQTKKSQTLLRSRVEKLISDRVLKSDAKKEKLETEETLRVLRQELKSLCSIVSEKKKEIYGISASLRKTDRIQKQINNALYSDPLIEHSNGEIYSVSSTSELVAGLSGASGATIAVAIPEGSIVKAVSARIVAEITGTATGWDLGYAGDLDAFGAGLALAAGTQVDIKDWTILNGDLVFTADTELVLTAAGGTFSAGDVRITVHYQTCSAPTS